MNISFADTTVEGYKKDAQQLRNKNNYLENQLKDFTAKLEGLLSLKFVLDVWLFSPGVNGLISRF